ncbi:MAG: hypothetical protein AAFO84_08115, partial [Cyanobacteria bacterium J06598_1]
MRNFIGWGAFSLLRKKLPNSVVYLSALPQILGAQENSFSAKSLRPQTQILIEQLQQFQLSTAMYKQSYSDNIFHFLSVLWSEFKIESERPGWIAFALSDVGLSYWLEHLQRSHRLREPIHTLVIDQPLVEWSAHSALLPQDGAKSSGYFR